MLSNSSRCLVIALSAAVFGLAGSPADAGAEQGLSSLSIEELTNLTVSSVSKRDQQLSKVAAAVYVITEEEIRRSGLTSIPELLRRVPGLQVARIDSSKWAVSSRGFNLRFADKMLVLIDGRSVYNNIYSGVYWDQNDLLLEDVARIEIIRGPGATMWGANAVNGVINIITKHAKATQGGLAIAQVGGEERGSGAVRYGGHQGDNVFYRAYSKFSDRRSFWNDAGQAANDRWRSIRGGGRLDWEPTGRDRFTFSGDVYGQGADQTVNRGFPISQTVFVGERVQTSGGFALGRWERTLKGSDIAVQTYYNDERRSELLGSAVLRTLDFDFQQHSRPLERHEVVWGAGYRSMEDSFTGSTRLFDPASRVDQLLSAFVQDDITLIPNRLSVTLGSKFLHNSYTGFEVQPGVRAAWTPGRQHTVWLSVARAVRTPVERDFDLRLETPIDVPGPIPTIVLTSGSKDFDSETMVAYEIGYRNQLGRRISLDMAGFVNSYDQVSGLVLGQPRVELTPSPRIIVPNVFTNVGTGVTNGMEAALSYVAHRKWKLQGGYSWVNANLHGRSRTTARDYQGDVWLTPANQFSVHSFFDFTRRISFDTSVYYVSPIAATDIPGYARADVGCVWKIGESGQFSAGVQNAQPGAHREFPMEDYVQTSAVRRTAYVRLTWKF